MKLASTPRILILITISLSFSGATGSSGSLRRTNFIAHTGHFQLDDQTTMNSSPSDSSKLSDINNVGVVLSSNNKKCATFMELFPIVYTCISTDAEFERQLLDENVTEMKLCDNFVYNSLDTLDLSGQTKTIVCSFGCEVNGNLFNGAEATAFTATGSASLTFCGIDFIDFFYTQSRVFLMNGTDVHSSFEECSFRNNGFMTRGISDSGVMSLVGGAASFSNCTFVGNQAPRGGVLQALGAAIVTVQNCEFHENKGTVGGVFITGVGVVTSITNSLFSKNLAAFGGVIMYFGSGTSTFSASEMIGNRAMMSGGVSYIEGSISMTTNFVSSRMTNNTATLDGGVVSLSLGSRTTLTSCVVTDNKAGRQGGAIYAGNGAFVVVTLSDFNGNVGGVHNSANETNGEHILVSEATMLIACSSGGNTFENPDAVVGVLSSDGTSVCM